MAVTTDRAPAARGLLGKRRVMLDAAVVLFLREGYARTTIDAVAAEAGISKQTVYNHVGDKERLFLEAVADALEPVATEVSDLVDSTLRRFGKLEEDLAAFGVGWLSVTTRPRIAALRRLVVAEGEHFPQLRSAWRRSVRDPALTNLTNFLACSSSRGAVLVSGDPARAARQLLALLSGEAEELSTSGADDPARAPLEELVDDAVSLFLRAHAPV
ncbi:TetR/AcrR family transcriptional regulator [Pseudonocardia ailaonensis]|uniref:TetR/AcrR family transcriptional regulator n=1 Tax=Pseudonocardia ailaonensis TaxID=367279 RepID=A0ABN2N4H3_9PSEU